MAPQQKILSPRFTQAAKTGGAFYKSTRCLWFFVSIFSAGDRGVTVNHILVSIIWSVFALLALQKHTMPCLFTLSQRCTLNIGMGRRRQPVRKNDGELIIIEKTEQTL